MHKVIIDTNVLLSGILFGGTPALLLEAIQKQNFIFCTSQQLYNEVFDKLINKFSVDADLLNDVSSIFNCGIMYVPTQTVNLPQDPDDAYLLELAETCKAHYLISGDKKHLIPLKNWKLTKIISPAQAEDILLQIE